MDGVIDESLIKIRDLTATVKLNNGEILTTVSNAHLELKRGHSNAIVGKSGSGKTSLISIIGLLNRCYQGEYIYNGTPVSTLSDRKLSMLRANNIGFVFQNYSLIKHLRVWENIELPLLYAKKSLGKRQRQDHIHKLLQSVGFVGGMNLAERYMRGFSWGIWRDTHIMLEGKAVHGLQTAFLLDWYFVDRTLITASRYFPKIDSCGNSLVQIVTSEPIGPWKEIMQGLTVAITSAKKYFYMQTPYFLPTEQILAAMQTAALSGVDVRLMLPERADNWITHLGSRSYLADVMQAGVKVYFYKKGFLHSKLMVSDDMLSTVGSTNVDFRSFEHNFEVNAFMYDVETALEMKEIFLQDQRESTQIFLKNWVRRSWRQKAAESIVRLLAPLL